MNGNNRWDAALPEPICFVLSGGSGLGAIQVGMLQALVEAGLTPDMVVGTSVGALNGAILAEHGLEQGTAVLQEIWENAGRAQIFPGGLWQQLYQLFTTRISLFRQTGLAQILSEAMTIKQYEALPIPFGAMATDILTRQGVLFTKGELLPTLLASAAIPGVYPPVEIDGELYIDGGVAANVPLQAAIDLGAASLVVLDVGDHCRLTQPPRHIAEIINVTIGATLRQRVLIEAPAIAEKLPLLYLPKPCTTSRSLFEFGDAPELIAKTADLVTSFLRQTPIPLLGSMSGTPHHHHEWLEIEMH